MSAPRLFWWIDGGPVRSIAPPVDFGSRDWILGVVAVQASIEDGRVVARARANVTGRREPEIEPLASGSVVHLFLGERPSVVPLTSAIEVPRLDGAAARIGLFVDGELIAQAALSRLPEAAEPVPRAFGHVFCRWRRDGGREAGYDLTDFLSLPGGVKYERIATGALEDDRVEEKARIVSYAFVAG